LRRCPGERSTSSRVRRHRRPCKNLTFQSDPC
jgi:hypothetical protein